MNQVLRPQFGPAHTAPLFNPLPLDGFEPIVIDLSKRRRKRRLMAQLRFYAMAGLCAVVALGIAGFMYAFMLPTPALSASDAYFIPAVLPAKPAAALSAPASQPLLAAVPEKQVAMLEPRLPPVPEKNLAPEAEALIPILQTLPVGKDFVPKSGMGLAMASLNPPARFRVSVIHDAARQTHDEAMDMAARAVDAGHADAAIHAYTTALNAMPDDRDAAYNLAALLLQKAAAFDNTGDAGQAARLYERALKIWNAKDSFAASIRERLDWVKQKVPPPPPQLVTPKFSELTD